MRRRFIKTGKKLVCMALAASMMISLAACGSKSDTKNETVATDNRITNQTNAIVQTTSQSLEATECYEEVVAESEIDMDKGMAFDSAVKGGAMNDMECVVPYYDGDYCEEQNFNTNEYNDVAENSWMSVKTSPLSTFAADVDTASYSELRSYILNGYGEIPASMVRIEEMINYFHYDYERPTGDDRFAVYTEYADCPWNKDTKLALISLSTEEIDFSEAPASNLVFLIDTSGSMFDSNKLPLVQQSLCMLAENLTEKDRISIVTYAGSDEVVLEGVTGDNYYEISKAIENLEAYGSTNGSAGINTAYEIAEKYYIKGGNNRVILATDGDLNVGVTSEGELEKLITDKKKSNVFLSVLGVGYGNFKDNKLETLADKGNGNYAYIDSIFEAKRALVDDMGANLLTVAKDVKLQVEFNPAQVKNYRLIGYENRTMAAEDFNDDTKDGGEMGAGHSVTALYEIALADSDFESQEIELKYSGNEASEDNEAVEKKLDSYGDELFTVSVRYKEPDRDVSKLESYVCKSSNYNKKGSDNLRWAAAVAGFGLLLKDSQYKGSCDAEMVLTIANTVADSKLDDYKSEFISLVEQYYCGEVRYLED